MAVRSIISNQDPPPTLWWAKVRPASAKNPRVGVKMLSRLSSLKRPQREQRVPERGSAGGGLHLEERPAQSHAQSGKQRRRADPIRRGGADEGRSQVVLDRVPGQGGIVAKAVVLEVQRDVPCAEQRSQIALEPVPRVASQDGPRVARRVHPADRVEIRACPGAGVGVAVHEDQRAGRPVPDGRLGDRRHHRHGTVDLVEVRAQIEPAVAGIGEERFRLFGVCREGCGQEQCRKSPHGPRSTYLHSPAPAAPAAAGSAAAAAAVASGRIVPQARRGAAVRAPEAPGRHAHCRSRSIRRRERAVGR